MPAIATLKIPGHCAGRPRLPRDEDEPPLHLALLQKSRRLRCAQIAEWDDANVWTGASFDVALLRSAWDYAERVTEFLVLGGEKASEANPRS